MDNFTPLSGFAGGALIGLAASLLLLGVGRIAGISGVMEGIIKPGGERRDWRLAFLIGLPLGAILVAVPAPELLPHMEVNASWPLLAVSGLLVGFGARIANGCTSGHGVCGIPRMATRSIAATIFYFGSAAATVYVIRHLL